MSIFFCNFVVFTQVSYPNKNVVSLSNNNSNQRGGSTNAATNRVNKTKFQTVCINGILYTFKNSITK